ncbi:MAG: GAF domain-containing sensor histidine kinase [Chloroflexi bacterium]|nr:GAF domain-containing sensor histidine kinase [Chloroflexota bacterium]MBP8059299.1 GAF domain-containing sensor histidine kinase [Chloroflexota bacterium]
MTELEELGLALAEMQLLYETSRRISAAADVDEVIAAYLEHVAVRGRYTCTVVLYEFTEQGEREKVRICGRWSPGEGLSLAQSHIPYASDALDAPLDAGQTLAFSDVYTDPRVSPSLREIQRQSGRPALVFIPLLVAGQRIGLVILSYSEVTAWSASELRPYEVTATQLAIGISTRLQQRLLFTSGQTVAVLQERHRLARELHDSVTQLIFSITLIAQSIAPAWKRNPGEGEKRVNRLLELSQQALAEMRALLFELRSPEPGKAGADTANILPGIWRVQRDGLVKALQYHLKTVNRYGPAIVLRAEEYQPQSLEQEIALYRITQEALNNIVKHARARLVTIECGLRDGYTYLLVMDDGVGFAAADSAQPSLLGGFGLRTMRERAEALAGTLEINTAPGQGTIVRVQLPGGREI